jgi:predicted permease
MEVGRASVTSGYFETMRIPLLEGRDFTDNDQEKAPRVAIVDQTMANHLWPKQDPVGRRFQMYGQWFTVVGMAGNCKHRQMNESPEPLVYLSLFQFGGPQRIIHVRTAGDPALLASPVEQAVHQLDSKLPVFDVLTLAQSIRMGSTFEVIESTFASAFAILALVLAASGIYGVVAYRTQLRTHEIGIRVALGASRMDVLRIILVQGLRLTFIGLATGLAFAFVLTRFLGGLLYGVSANDPLTIVSVTGLLAVIAILACYLPALRAMRIDPVAAMRVQ